MISPFWLVPKSESEAGPMIFDFEILSMFLRPSADMWLTRDVVSRDIASWQYLLCNTSHLEGIITLIPLSLWFIIQNCSSIVKTVSIVTSSNKPMYRNLPIQKRNSSVCAILYAQHQHKEFLSRMCKMCHGGRRFYCYKTVLTILFSTLHHLRLSDTTKHRISYTYIIVLSVKLLLVKLHVILLVLNV